MVHVLRLMMVYAQVREGATSQTDRPALEVVMHGGERV